MRLAFAFFALSAAFVLSACPPSQSSNGDASRVTTAAVCTKLGDNCEVSPGKLGTCVVRDDCKEPAGCYVCQSQH